jgi:RNA polymerase sigma-70 factor (ECF subfamily)
LREKRKPKGVFSMELSDEELVAKAKKNDRRAFESLVNRHQKMVFNLAYRMLGNREDAEDAAQDSFIRLYHSITKFRGQAKFTTWLYRIVSNVCLSKLSTSAARQSFVELDTETESIYSEVSDWEDTPEDILLKETCTIWKGPPTLRSPKF